MNGQPWDRAGQARRALHGIVRDPHYGSAALSQPAVMSNLLKDLLPDEPREAGLLVAAAQADLAGTLRGYVAQGLDSGTAVSLTANSFIASSSHTPEACTWVVTELALALGMDPSATPAQQVTVPPPGQPTVIAAPNAGFVQAPAPFSPTGQGQPNQWPQSTSPTPPGTPKPTGPTRIVAGVIGLAGALFILLGCLVPYLKYPGQHAVGVFSGFPGAPGSQAFWFSAEPVGVLLAAIAVSILVMARPRGGILGPGMLTAFGIQTILLFAGYVFTVYPPAKRDPGAILGLLGGIALLIAGLMSLAAVMRRPAGQGQSQQTDQMPVSPQPGVIPGPY